MYKKIIILVAVLFLIIAMIYFCTYDKNKVGIEAIKTDAEMQDVTFEKEDEVLNDDIIGMLKIDKIGLNACIKEGSNSKILKSYIGHIEDTSLYDGNVGLAAHNRGGDYAFFARLNELEQGDQIIYHTKYGDKQYVVIDKKVIMETDWSMLKDTNDNRITMITCIKNKENQRLCVQAIEENDRKE